MDHPILKSINAKLGIPDTVDFLSDRLNRSELNSFLLALFDKITAKSTPSQLLKQYQQNHFVKPAAGNMVTRLEKEIETLKVLESRQFTPIELSPVSPLGACSVVAAVDQKKIISATRSSEVLADATNALALHIAHLKKGGKSVNAKFSSVHRHVRTQPLTEKWMMPHFKIACLVSAGKDEGNYLFEQRSLVDHFETLHTLMNSVFGIKDCRFKLQRRNGIPNGKNYFDKLYAHCQEQLPSYSWESETPLRSNNYYKGIQFKMIIKIGRQELEIADGGFVDWTQQLTGNKKERFLIAGFGLELLLNLLVEEKKQNPAQGRAL